jgi:hypothetical protein
MTKNHLYTWGHNEQGAKLIKGRTDTGAMNNEGHNEQGRNNIAPEILHIRNHFGIYFYT